jgi:hypothetical protein
MKRPVKPTHEEFGGSKFELPQPDESAHERKLRRDEARSESIKVFQRLAVILTDCLGSRAAAAAWLLRVARENAKGSRSPSRDPILDDYLLQAVEIQARHMGTMRGAPRQAAKAIYDLQKHTGIYYGPSAKAIETRIGRLLRRKK